MKAIARIVRAAVQAPSGENCQPFTFSWDGAALAIHHDAERARHVLDVRGHASCVTLGCVIESIAIAAASEGFEARAKLSIGEDRWAEVTFEEGPGAAADLAPGLDTRCTDRRLFRGGSMDHPVFAALARDAARFGDTGLHVAAAPRLPTDLRDYLKRAETYVWQHEDAFRDVVRWLRISRRELDETRDGMPWNGFGVELPETRWFALARAPKLGRLLGASGLAFASKRWLSRQLASSAALVCVTARSPNREALVSAGRVGLAAWVRLNQAGFGVQPLTSPALLALNASMGALPVTVRPEFETLLARGCAIMSRGFGYPTNELPVWMLRTGISPPLAAHLRAPRRRIEDVFVDLSGGPRS